MTTFRQRLAAAMTRRGVNQKDLADLCGVTPAYVSNVLAGKTVPSLEYAERLANAVGLELRLVRARK